MIFSTAEQARKYVMSTQITDKSFDLAIADNFTFAGQRDVEGAGMALVLDAILAQGYGPAGFEQRDGYRLYHYVPLK